jgi:membrane protease YdiL (CAAX protease family)
VNPDRIAARRLRVEPPVAAVFWIGAAWFLLARPGFATLGRVGTPGLAIGYIAMGLVSAFASAPVPVSADPSASPTAIVRPGAASVARGPWIPLAVGAAAVLIARAAAGPSPSLRAGPVAVALGVGAAVAEEAFFRGFLFGRLERWSVGVAMAGSALAFALIHLPLYGWTAFPVDLGAGLLFSWQRAASDRWTVPAGTHALANLLAVLR